MIFQEKSDRLSGLSVAGDLTSLLEDYLKTRGIRLPALQGRQKHQRLTYALWWSLLDDAQARLPDVDLGPELARRVAPVHLGVIGYLAESCGTVLEAFHHFERFQRLLYEGPRARLEVRDGLAGLVWDAGFGASSRLSDQVILGGLLTFLRRMTGRDDLMLSRTDVIWNDWPGGRGFLAHTGGEMRFDASANAVWFDARYLILPLIQYNSQALTSLRSAADEALSGLPLSAVLTAEVQRLLIELLPLGGASQAQVASRLAMSERTLLRRLRAEGTGFRDLLNRVRTETACRYLSGSPLTLSEIALLLGYSEQAAFNRAFRKATGKTPGQWRS